MGLYFFRLNWKI